MSSTTEFNRQHFNHTAPFFDNSSTRLKVAENCVKVILSEVGSVEEEQEGDSSSSSNVAGRHGESLLLDEEKTEVLDYACGTGLISQNLLPYVKSVLGVDVSEKMVDVYNQKCWQQGLETDEMHAVCLDLLAPSGGDGGAGNDPLNGRKFDLVVCASSYHHLPEINSATRILSNYLKPRGLIFIFDLKFIPGYSYKFHNHVDNAITYPGGFREEELEKALRNTNLLEHVQVKKAFTFNNVVGCGDGGGVEREFEFIVAKGQRKQDAV